MHARGESVRLRIVSKILKTSVSLARCPGAFRIDLVEITDDRIHRSMQAVQVQSVDADFWFICSEAFIMRLDPSHQVENIRVAPHPAGETFVISERIECRRGLARVAAS